jgi:hypothetical protein
MQAAELVNENEVAFLTSKHENPAPNEEKMAGERRPVGSVSLRERPLTEELLREEPDKADFSRIDDGFLWIPSISCKSVDGFSR